MKNITIAGRVGKDAELRRTQQNEPVLSFTVAVDDGFGQNKRTMWFDCSVWGKRATSLDGHIVKGMAVTVSGDLSTREHKDKTYFTVRANELTMQGGKPEGQRQERQSGYERDEDSGSAAALDDEIPFACEWR